MDSGEEFGATPSLALSVSLSGPLSCQSSAFCGLLRDEESEQFRVTSVATASSGRGCLGYLAAPAALTVRNCLIKQSDKRKVFGLREVQ